MGCSTWELYFESVTLCSSDAVAPKSIPVTRTYTSSNYFPIYHYSQYCFPLILIQPAYIANTNHILYYVSICSKA